jgi:phosphoenolpyruvate carboxykinase (ATP)
MEMLQTHPGLEALGFRNLNMVYYQLRTPQLYEQVLRRQEGFLAHLGPLVVRTGDHTGRSPNDKFIVRDATTEGNVWWGPFTEEQSDRLYNKVLAYYQGKNAFIQDAFAGADPAHRLSVRIVTEMAWHSLFVRNMFIRPALDDLANFVPEFTVIHAPNFHAMPELDGTNSSVFIVINFTKHIVLIGGSSYAGEIKKSIFTVLNYLLPQKGVFPMHCSANIGKAGDTALFFGLSGTGKTTLSADPERTLIGDDEHGWSDHGIFNFEGGCYAKVINLSSVTEPEIYETTRRFGTILENVAMDMQTRELDLDDASFTENTRASYPISHIPNATRTGLGEHPRNVVFLTADAFGVLPPIARLTAEQAIYHFINGYTAKVAGTEKGIKTPQTTFSACFGAPFLPLHPMVYAELLDRKISTYKVNVWLINTGWTGGPYRVGERMSLPHTRRIVHAALNGELDDIGFVEEPFFGLMIPTDVPGVPRNILNPRNTWADTDTYDLKARELADKFDQNYQQYAARASTLASVAAVRR